MGHADSEHGASGAERLLEAAQRLFAAKGFAGGELEPTDPPEAAPTLVRAGSRHGIESGGVR